MLEMKIDDKVLFLSVLLLALIIVLFISRSSDCSSHEGFYERAYRDGDGPEYGKPMGVAIPAGTLKETNEDAPYRASWYPYEYGARARVLTPSPTGGTVIAPPFNPDDALASDPNSLLSGDIEFARDQLITPDPPQPWIWRTDNLYGMDSYPYRYKPPTNTTIDYLHPYDGNRMQLDMPYGRIPPGRSFPDNQVEYGDKVSWNGQNNAGNVISSWVGGIPLTAPPPPASLPSLRGLHYGSVSAYAPFPEVNTPWEKIGILKPISQEENTHLILTLFRKPIAPLNDIFAYSIQDKDGNILPLPNRYSYIIDGDVIEANAVPGYESAGPFTARVFVNNKWVYA